MPSFGPRRKALRSTERLRKLPVESKSVPPPDDAPTGRAGALPPVPVEVSGSPDMSPTAASSLGTELVPKVEAGIVDLEEEDREIGELLRRLRPAATTLARTILDPGYVGLTWLDRCEKAGVGFGEFSRFRYSKLWRRVVELLTDTLPETRVLRREVLERMGRAAVGALPIDPVEIGAAKVYLEGTRPSEKEASPKDAPGEVEVTDSMRAAVAALLAQRQSPGSASE